MLTTEKGCCAFESAGALPPPCSAILLGTVVYLGNKAFDLDFKGLTIAERFTAEVSRNLRRLRLHHQLALFEFIDTVALLDELVYKKSGTSDHPETDLSPQRPQRP